MAKDFETQLKKEQEKALKFIEKYRKKYVPKKYNQIELFDHLFDKGIDWYVAISTRTDGKSFNYLGALLALCSEFDTGFTLICRHYTLRKVYFALLQKIMHTISYFNPEDLQGEVFDDYIEVHYKGKSLGVITDLNNASDLKYSSNVLADYPIILYDEFLAIATDYLPDEDERLKTIYESIDRDFSDNPKRIIQTPIIILLGNAVNFDSPILAYLDLFNKLEQHKMNTLRKYENIILEMRMNKNSNEKRNLRAFKSENDAMTTGEFKFNNFQIVSEEQRAVIKKGDYYNFFIKDVERYIKVSYNKERKMYLISVVSGINAHEPEFCTQVVDVDNHTKLIKETFYSDSHYKRYAKGFYLFENSYSKNYILGNDLVRLNILKLCSLHSAQYKETLQERTDRMFINQKEDNLKKALAKKFFAELY